MVSGRVNPISTIAEPDGIVFHSLNSSSTRCRKRVLNIDAMCEFAQIKWRRIFSLFWWTGLLLEMIRNNINFILEAISKRNILVMLREIASLNLSVLSFVVTEQNNKNENSDSFHFYWQIVRVLRSKAASGASSLSIFSFKKGRFQ